jgi:pyrroline-5-carboxylate reductase
MHDITIAFIGGGNMARSLIVGLLADGISPHRMRVADPDPAALENLSTHFGVSIAATNTEAILDAHAVVLAVKPQVAKSVVEELAPVMGISRPVFISVAAGIRIASIRRWSGTDLAIVRTMPNTPALVGAGATALCANPVVTHEQKSVAESILRAVGMTLWIEDESLMDAITALSGSGPAYFFLVMEALAEAGHALGLSRETAKLLILQTAFGAAKMALENPEDLRTLRRRVTSPGGTTEHAIKVLQDHDIEGMFCKALRAAYDRSIALATLFGDD